MKTTIDIPEDLLKEAMRHTRAKTKREAIVTAVEEFNRRRRMAGLVRHLGTCRNLMSADELAKMREAD